MGKRDVKLWGWLVLLFAVFVISAKLLLGGIKIKEVNIKSGKTEIKNTEISNLSLEALSTQKEAYFSLTLPEKEAILINLSKMKLYLIQDKKIIKEFDVVSKGPANKWFRTPAGYYRVGMKSSLLRSSKVDVFMPYSLQFYEDFFVHGIPYYPNGVRVTSAFSGGCLRLHDEDAKVVYDFSKRGMMIILIDEIPTINPASPFIYPLDMTKSWIRQSFISPQKVGTEYLQHAGVDFATVNPDPVFAVYDGTVSYIQNIGPADHGFGNLIILKHEVNGEEVYTLYGHLDSIAEKIKIGETIKQGEIIGNVGASGYGCNNYWRLGNDGCFEPNVLDRHLHFEVKTAPVLTNPTGGDICSYKGEMGPCFGYTPKYPQNFGYINPISFLNAEE